MLSATEAYYYDKETGMYYLKNRYYDSEIRRFICADGQMNSGSLGKICMHTAKIMQ
ncbi:RHS repeat-associated core domain-containing protein [Blautia sp.]|uniref:RHS repeat-associated core domain-containing protein n=1 Tax=Blautia sp. TaxID=1955243 RepID=UPI003D913750